MTKECGHWSLMSVPLSSVEAAWCRAAESYRAGNKRVRNNKPEFGEEESGTVRDKREKTRKAKEDVER